MSEKVIGLNDVLGGSDLSAFAVIRLVEVSMIPVDIVSGYPK